MKKFILLALVVVMAFVLCACGTIESGTTGVKVVDGIVQNEPIPEGRYGILGKRTSVVRVNNKRQSVTYNDTLYGESNDQTVVLAQGITITYQINKDASVWMVRNIGSDFQKNIIPAAKIASSVKNALANIPTEKCTNRSYIEPAVKEEMQIAVDEYYYPDAITIFDVSITQMDYEDDYNRQIAQISALKKQSEADAIANKIKIENAKAEADEEATRAEAAKKTAEANAEVALIKAQSDAEIAKVKAQSAAEAVIIEADAQAEANKKIADSITEEFIEHEKIQKWNGDVPTVSGAATPFISMDISE